MATLGPILIILALYLVFVLKVGPAFMRKRDAYKLTFVMLVYNGVQVAISVYLVARVSKNIRWQFKHNLVEIWSILILHAPPFNVTLLVCVPVTELLMATKDLCIASIHLFCMRA